MPTYRYRFREMPYKITAPNILVIYRLKHLKQNYNRGTNSANRINTRNVMRKRKKYITFLDVVIQLSNQIKCCKFNILLFNNNDRYYKYIFINLNVLNMFLFQHYDCRNHVRVIQPIGDGTQLYICGTNAHNPKDWVIYVSC